MLVYKMVRKKERNKKAILTSFTAIFFHRGVLYQPSKKTKPKRGCGPLCAFDSFETADEFSSIFSGLEDSRACQIWLAEAELSLENTIWFPSKMFFGFPSRHKQKSHKISLPKGTVLCNSITLLERLK